DDADTLFGWINTPDTVRFNAAFTPVHEPSHLAWFERVTADPARIIFAIREKSTQRLVGVIQLIDIHPVHRSAELIIRIGADGDRGQGFGSEAVRMMTEFAFRDRNLQRVSLKVFANNARAIRAYEKAGLQTEGLLRRAAFIDGHWQNEVVMAVLAEAA
ncbi:MAG: N-acetyltransferase, partial [Hyphomicrobiales bacterium]